MGQQRALRWANVGFRGWPNVGVTVGATLAQRRTTETLAQRLCNVGSPDHSLVGKTLAQRCSNCGQDALAQRWFTGGTEWLAQRWLTGGETSWLTYA